MKTLHLNLFLTYFNEIKEGYKKEEYRQITAYWANRLLLYDGEIQKKVFWKKLFDIWTNDGFKIHDELINLIEFEIVSFRQYSDITFSNGYDKNRSQYQMRYYNIEIGPGYTKWGAKKKVTYFIFKLAN